MRPKGKEGGSPCALSGEYHGNRRERGEKRSESIRTVYLHLLPGDANVLMPKKSVAEAGLQGRSRRIFKKGGGHRNGPKASPSGKRGKEGRGREGGAGIYQNRCGER